MKKNAALQIIALALAFILVAGVIVGVIFWQNGNISFTPVGQEQTATPGEETPNKEIPAPSIETTISDNEHIRLTMSAAVTAADSNYVEQVLTATVNPSTAEEKGVDWKAEWADASAAPSSVHPLRRPGRAPWAPRRRKAPRRGRRLGRVSSWWEILGEKETRLDARLRRRRRDAAPAFSGD